MCKKQSVREKEVTVDLDGYKTGLFLCSSILAECERIKAEAKVLLEDIITSGNDENTADIRVRDFLRESIKTLLGNKADEVFKHQPVEIPDLTAVLCRLIAGIGSGLGSADNEE